jgi:hypothetical protein
VQGQNNYNERVPSYDEMANYDFEGHFIELNLVNQICIDAQEDESYENANDLSIIKE